MKILAYIIAGLAALLGAGYVWLMFNGTTSLSREALSEYEYETLTLPGPMQVNYRVLGNPDGPAVLMIHGAGGSLDDWKPWLPALEGKYRLHLVDFPGHGLTDPLINERYRPSRFAEFIRDVVNELGLKDFTIIAHSFGGDSALRYALAYPDQPKAMVLVASGGFRPPDDKIPEDEKELAIWAKLGLSRTLLPFLQNRDVVRETVDLYFYNKSANTDAYVDKVYNLLRYKKNRGVMVELLAHSLNAYVNVSGLDRLTFPTLVLWGDKDPVVPLEFARKFEHELPDVRLKVYPNVGHMVFMENTEQSAADVTDFLHEVYQGDD
ncbi:alpha/beta fold hydrolase [Ruegeria halocynthiae]|uniref:alpha/beta fold hydrolase n=1 Tax=Ruegeria halocynthiae TaxID=985054 RepID=UPI00055E3F2B|nr:alpha/beta hydrolase [Ruegeria halocynthiae]